MLRYPWRVNDTPTRKVSEKASETVPEIDLPEQMRVRHDKRARLLDEGRDPYPVGVPRTHTLTAVREAYAHLQAAEETQDVVGVAGRVVFIRNTGKLAFATLQEGDGTRLQAMLSLAEVGEPALAAWKADVDLGDFVFIHGRVISSRRGELSVLADEWAMASKALRPLPTMHSELSEESRVRQRYVDLGDFVFIQGRVISSKRGELSVLADEWAMASKALRPLPTMHSELSEES
ncbi:MAG: lysyl-tRNA synthetase, class, partial [Actinomycetota bacterium]|nr:lysyl-tRNA synthetase, class [Actinomycetota bacterium]